MRLGWVLSLCLLMLVGCVSTGDVDPLETSQGRQDARDSYIRLGLGYLQKGMLGKAKARLGKALELDADSAEAHAALALVFQTEMETALADQHFQKALDSDPHNARILNNYGSFLFEQQRYAEAEVRFQAASEDSLYSERSRVFENLGLVNLKLNRPEQAKSYFQRALRHDHRRTTALLELAQMNYDAQRYVPAKRYYDRFEELSAQNARSLLLGIRLADRFNEPAKRGRLAEQLERLYPASPEYQSYLGASR